MLTFYLQISSELTYILRYSDNHQWIKWISPFIKRWCLWYQKVFITSFCDISTSLQVKVQENCLLGNLTQHFKLQILFWPITVHGSMLKSNITYTYRKVCIFFSVLQYFNFINQHKVIHHLHETTGDVYYRITIL